MRRLSGQLFAWLFLSFAILFTVALFTDGLLLRPQLARQQMKLDLAQIRAVESALIKQQAQLKVFVRMLSEMHPSPAPSSDVLALASNLPLDAVHFVDQGNLLTYSELLTEQTRAEQKTRHFEQRLFSYLMPILELKELPATGMINTPVGPAMFAVAQTRDSNGTWIVWRLWTSELQSRVVPDAHELIARWLYANDTAKSLRRAAASLAPADQRESLRDNGVIRWTINDMQGQPLMLMEMRELSAPQSNLLVHNSTLIMMFAAALTMLAVWLLLRQNFYRPIHTLVERLRRVADDREYTMEIQDIGNSGLRPLVYEGGRLVTLLHQMEQSLIKSNRRVEQLSKTDNLTGLGNRNQFEEFITREWERARQLQRPITLALCDVDALQKYNRQHGHNQGDMAIKQIAQALEDNVHRATDLVARYGGEEFMVVLTDTDIKGAEAVMEKLLNATRRLNLVMSDPLSPGFLTISIGAVSLCPDMPLKNIEQLLKFLNHQLQNAKRAKGNCWKLSNTLEET